MGDIANLGSNMVHMSVAEKESHGPLPDLQPMVGQEDIPRSVMTEVACPQHHGSPSTPSLPRACHTTPLGCMISDVSLVRSC